MKAHLQQWCVEDHNTDRVQCMHHAVHCYINALDNDNDWQTAQTAHEPLQHAPPKALWQWV